MNKHCQLLSGTIGMLDFPRAVSLSYHLMQCAKVPGDIVEFGCNAGHTAALMASLTEKHLWVYDSFKGLPAGNEAEGGEKTVGVMATTQAELREYFRDHGLDAPTVVEGYFNELTHAHLPDQIAFAHIDADLDQSTFEALNFVWPRLSRFGICVVDDYSHPDWPGVKIAVDHYFPEVNFIVPWGADGKPIMQCVIIKL